MLNIFQIEILFKESKFNELFKYTKQYFVRVDEIGFKLRSNRITEGGDIKRGLTILTGILLVLKPIYGLSIVYESGREGEAFEKLKNQAKIDKILFKPMIARKEAKLTVLIEKKFKVLILQYIESIDRSISVCQTLLSFEKRIFGND